MGPISRVQMRVDSGCYRDDSYEGRKRMRTWREILLTATAVVAMGAAAPAIAQNATVHGKVINPAGQPVTDGQVKFTKDVSLPPKERKFVNTVQTDAQGNYKAADVAPGDYVVIVTEQGKDVDFQQVNGIKAGDDKTVDFDMTRAEYINSMTPEQKKALEDYKKNASAAIDANKKIANLNATLATVRADLAAARPTGGDVSKDVSDMKAAVDAKPDESIPVDWLWQRARGSGRSLRQGRQGRAQAGERRRRRDEELQRRHRGVQEGRRAERRIKEAGTR